MAKETVVATIGSSAVQEAELMQRVKDLQGQVKACVIETDEDYKQAGQLGTALKTLEKDVKTYFDPLCNQAHKLHQELTARRKAETDPINECQRMLKSAMASYQLELQRQREEEERKAREAAEAALQKQLEEAAKAEQQGDKETAETILESAEITEDTMTSIKVEQPEVKVNGVSHKKAWEVKVTDPAKVPAYFDGICIRTINENAIKNIIKEHDGNVTIPGVEFKETLNFSFRGN